MKIKRIHGICILLLMTRVLSSCEKEVPEPDPPTVCITCVRISNHDTMPDHCLPEDQAQNYINRMAEHRVFLTGEFDPYSCRVRK